MEDEDAQRAARRMARWALMFAAAPLVVSVTLNELPLDTDGSMAAGLAGILMIAGATAAALVCSIAAIRTCTPSPPLALVALGSAGTLTAYALTFIVVNALKFAL